MRRQDELRALFPDLDVFHQKHVLAELDAFARSHDSEEILRFLRSRIGDTEPLIAHQALFGLHIFLPGFVRRKFGVSKADLGIWTRFRKGEDTVGDATSGDDAATDGKRLQGFGLLDPLVEPLSRWIRDPDPRRHTPARLAIAQLPFPRVHETLLDTAKSSGTEFSLLMACSRAGGGSDPGFLDALQGGIGRQPDLALAAVGVPTNDLPGLVERLAPRGHRLGRANLAILLGRHPGEHLWEAVDRLLGFEDSWVDVYALRAMELWGDPRGVSRIRKIHDRTGADFVRSRALQALGGVGGDQALELCLHGLDATSPQVQAQALESVIRLRCPADILKERAAAFLDHPSLSARVHALLAVVEPGSRNLPKPFLDLVRSESPLERLEAMYCLGYWGLKSGRDLLARAALEDPEPWLALQAVRSLAKYPPEHGLEGLRSVLAGRRDEVAVGAAHALSRYEGEDARKVCGNLAARLGEGAGGFESALIFRVLGTLGGRHGIEEVEDFLLKGLNATDRHARRGALEGWKTYGCARKVDLAGALALLMDGDDERSAVSAWSVAWLQGDLGALDRFREVLDGKDPDRLPRVLDATHELGLLMAEVYPEGRFPALEESIRATDSPTEDAPVAGRCWSRGEVRDPYAPDASLPDRPPAAPSGDAVDRLFQELEAGPRRPGRKGPSLAAQLKKSAYALPLEPLSGPAAGLWDRLTGLRRAPVLVGAALVGVVLVAGSIGGSSPTLPPPLPPVGLVTIFAEGKVSRGTQGILVGDEIRLGETVAVPAGARARFRTAMGNSVVVPGPGRLTVEDLAWEPEQIQLGVEPGAYSVEFGGDELVVLHHGDVLLGGLGVELELSVVEGRFQAHVISGTARVRIGEGETREVGRGTRVDLDRGGA